MKYNYFDDDEENEAREYRTDSALEAIKDRLSPRRLAYDIKELAETVANGELFSNIRELPHTRNMLFKLLAFVLFIILVIAFIFGFSHAVNSRNEKNNRFSVDAGKVCTDISVKYGSVKWESLDSEIYGKDKARLIGLCYARQMDFDNDGSAELMVCYDANGTYILEIYSYVDDEFVSVYCEEANSTNDQKDGSWIGFYHSRNKYYICKSEKENPQKVSFYALKGDKFKEDGGCDYDYKNDIYSFKGEINATDFETIKLSVIRKSRAEYINDIVAENLEAFSSFSIASLGNKKSSTQLKNEAYYEVIKKRIAQYGKAEKKKENGVEYLSGVAYVDLMDFNKDDNDELVLVFRKNLKQSATNYYTGESIIIEVPTYCMEVYSWNGSVAKRIFSKDNISNYLEDSDVNYVLFQNTSKKIRICSNRYTYENSQVYTASSKIYDLKKGKFEATFDAKKKYSYGYSDYYINDQYTYSYDFEANGYKVPLFMNDDGKVDTSKYSIIYFSGKKGYDYNVVIDNTVKVIQSINSSYLPED